MTIVAKYPGKCSVCGKPIRPGEKIEWSKGVPVRHTDCAATTATTSPILRQARRPGRWTGCSCGSREDSSGALIPSPHNCRQCEFDNE